MANINVNGTSYPFRVAINTFRILGKKLGLEMQGINDRLSEINREAAEGKPLSISDMEFFADFIMAGIHDGLRKEPDPTKQLPSVDDIIDLFDGGSEIEKAFTELNGNMPDAPENPQKPEGNN